MVSVEQLTPQQRDAIVECLRIFARRGRQVREEHAEKENHPTTLAGEAAGDSAGASGTNFVAEVCADA